MGNKKTAKPILAALLAATLLLLPMFISDRYIMTLIDQILIFIIAVLGLNYITGLTGQNNMGMAGIFSIGAYFSAIFTMRTGLSPFLGVLLCIPLGLLIGQLLGRPSLRVKGVYLAMSTMMFGEIVRLVINNLDWLTSGSNGIRNIPRFSIFGYVLKWERQQYYVYLVVCVLALLITRMVFDGRWGREFRSIRDNEDGVASCGIDIAKTKVTAFTMCAIFGCVAGGLYAHLMGYIQPAIFDFNFMVKFFMMIMLGGIGTISGSIFGAILVVVLPEALRFVGDWYYMIFAFLNLLIILFLPNGIVSIKDHVVNGYRRIKAKKGGAAK